jgi:drug/metabolite transporter (DMT)-like permease
LLGVAATVVITALIPVLTTMTSKTVAREKPSLTNVAGALLTSAGIAITVL